MQPQAYKVRHFRDARKTLPMTRKVTGPLQFTRYDRRTDRSVRPVGPTGRSDRSDDRTV